MVNHNRCSGSSAVDQANIVESPKQHLYRQNEQTQLYAYFSSSLRLSSSSRSLFTRSSRSRSSCINFSRSRRRFRIDLSLRCFVRSKSTCKQNSFILVKSITTTHLANFHSLFPVNLSYLVFLGFLPPLLPGKNHKWHRFLQAD